MSVVAVCCRSTESVVKNQGGVDNAFIRAVAIRAREIRDSGEHVGANNCACGQAVAGSEFETVNDQGFSHGDSEVLGHCVVGEE